MRGVRYHDDARLEFLHEVGFYSAINRRLGERFDKAVEQAEVFASTFPEIWVSIQIRYAANIDKEVSVLGRVCRQ